MKVVSVFLLLSLLITLCQSLSGIAYLRGTKHDSGILGTVKFTENGDKVTVTISIEDITGNQNESIGLHVHEFGDARSDDGMSAGSHFVGDGSPDHGCPPGERHAGDLGSFDVQDGSIDDEVEFDLLKLQGVNSIIGRAVVLHSNIDNCENPSGNAGDRLAYGVIGLMDEAAITSEADISSAVCVLQGVKGYSFISGTVELKQNGDMVTINANVQGITGNHGFHIHQFGDIEPTGANVGGHYDPLKTLKHALPGSGENHHLGDLGNIEDGKFSGSFEMTLTGENGILGRAMIIHEKEDIGENDFGSKIAQCVIGIANPKTSPTPTPEDENPEDTSSKGIEISTSRAMFILLSSILLLFIFDN